MTDDISEEVHMLAAEYALGLMTPEEAQAFEELLDVDSQSRAAYAFWAEHFASLTDDVPEAEPSNRVLTGIRSELFGPEAPTWRRRLGLLPAMAGGLLAAIVALWVIDVSFGPAIDRPIANATLIAEAQGLEVRVSYAYSGETLTVTRVSGDAPEGRALELWLLKEDQPAISLGVLPDDANGQLQIAADVRELLRGAQCAISVEPPGGSPTGAPTGEVIAIAPVVWET